MKSFSAIVVSVFFFIYSHAQNVGIGTPTPVERLDVNGNINVNGTIKVNGADGTAGQVLMKNNTGTMVWADLCNYKNFVSLTSTVSDTWIVPAGVTSILVEVWGAGGGGNTLAGGGGGGYCAAKFTVTPGTTINYVAGTLGSGAVLATAGNGGNSTCTVNGFSVTGYGGGGALFLSAVNGQGGQSGGGDLQGASNNFIAKTGAPGQSQKRNFWQFNATTFYESGEAGRGGNSGNTDNTGGLGQYYLYNNTGSTLVYRNGNPSSGYRPGGGGASGVQYGTTNIGGGNGANGLIIIHY
ncbi:MAG: hypothetical protein HEQ40_07750 [Lacibacter sp.]|jgi:hypothetical protein